MSEQEEMIVHIGRLCGLKNLYEALSWIRDQDGYKNKTVRYIVYCDDSEEVDR